MKDYFEDLEDALVSLENRICGAIDPTRDPLGNYKMTLVMDAFATIRRAMKGVNAAMGLEMDKLNNGES